MTWIEDIPFEADEMLPLHVPRYISDLPENERAAEEALVPANIYKREREEAARKKAEQAEDATGSKDANQP